MIKKLARYGILFAMLLTLRALSRDIPLALNTSALLCITIGSASLALAGFWVRGTSCFMTHPLLIAAAFCTVSYLILLAVFEMLGLSRLRELGSVIARGRARA